MPVARRSALRRQPRRRRAHDRLLVRRPARHRQSAAAHPDRQHDLSRDHAATRSRPFPRSPATRLFGGVTGFVSSVADTIFEKDHGQELSATRCWPGSRMKFLRSPPLRDHSASRHLRRRRRARHCPPHASPRAIDSTRSRPVRLPAIARRCAQSSLPGHGRAC